MRENGDHSGEPDDSREDGDNPEAEEAIAVAEHVEGEGGDGGRAERSGGDGVEGETACGGSPDGELGSGDGGAGEASDHGAEVAGVGCGAYCDGGGDGSDVRWEDGGGGEDAGGEAEESACCGGCGGDEVVVWAAVEVGRDGGENWGGEDEAHGP